MVPMVWVVIRREVQDKIPTEVQTHFPSSTFNIPGTGLLYPCVAPGSVTAHRAGRSAQLSDRASGARSLEVIGGKGGVGHRINSFIRTEHLSSMWAFLRRWRLLLELLLRRTVRQGGVHLADPTDPAQPLHQGEQFLFPALRIASSGGRNMLWSGWWDWAGRSSVSAPTSL